MTRGRRGLVLMTALRRARLCSGAAQRRGTGKPPPQAPAPRRRSRRRKRPRPPTPPNSIGSSRPATEARQAQRWEEAIAPVREGRQAEARSTSRATGTRARRTTRSTTSQKCRDAFRKVVRLAPKNGAAFAFLGLCEFGAEGLRPVAASTCCSRGFSASATRRSSAASPAITPPS